MPSDIEFADRLEPYIESLATQAITARPIEWF